MAEATQYNTLLRRSLQVLFGNEDLPDGYKITKSCKRGHGVNGETVRFPSGACVFCDSEKTDKRRTKKASHDPKSAAIKADHLREELELAKELDDYLM